MSGRASEHRSCRLRGASCPRAVFSQSQQLGEALHPRVKTSVLQASPERVKGAARAWLLTCKLALLDAQEVGSEVARRLSVNVLSPTLPGLP